MPGSPTVTGALFTLLASDTLLTTLVPGGFWLDDAPEGVGLPYGVVEHLGEVPQWTSEAPIIDTTRWRITVYATRDVTSPAAQPNHPAEACEKIVWQVKKVLDNDTDNKLVIQGQGEVSLLRQLYRLSLANRRDPSGERVYQGELTYAARVESLRPGRGTWPM